MTVLVIQAVEVVSDSGQSTGDVFAQTGAGLGSVLAVVLSWERNRSILLAILAAFFSWVYVIYFAATRRDNER